MDAVTESVKVAFNDMGMQLISFALIIVAAYVISYLLLSVIKVPVGLRKFISTMVMLVAMYFSFNSIFLS